MTRRSRSRTRVTIALVGLLALVVFGWLAQHVRGDAAGGELSSLPAVQRIVEVS